MRIKTVDSTTQITVYRGALGTTSKGHIDNSLVRPITVIPSEVRRFSSIRASGHTFEYVGYGPGNYSTALPQKQRRVIEENEEFPAISKEEKGGVTFFSGMNDRVSSSYGTEELNPEKLSSERSDLMRHQHLMICM